MTRRTRLSECPTDFYYERCPLGELGCADVGRVLPVLKEAIDSEKLDLISIINTHQYVPVPSHWKFMTILNHSPSHHDHAGGNTEIVRT